MYRVLFTLTVMSFSMANASSTFKDRLAFFENGGDKSSKRKEENEKTTLKNTGQKVTTSSSTTTPTPSFFTPDSHKELEEEQQENIRNLLCFNYKIRKDLNIHFKPENIRNFSVYEGEPSNASPAGIYCLGETNLEHGIVPTNISVKLRTKTYTYTDKELFDLVMGAREIKRKKLTQQVNQAVQKYTEAHKRNGHGGKSLNHMFRNLTKNTDRINTAQLSKVAKKLLKPFLPATNLEFYRVRKDGITHTVYGSCHIAPVEILSKEAHQRLFSATEAAFETAATSTEDWELPSITEYIEKLAEYGLYQQDTLYWNNWAQNFTEDELIKIAQKILPCPDKDEASAVTSHLGNISPKIIQRALENANTYDYTQGPLCSDDLFDSVIESELQKNNCTTQSLETEQTRRALEIDEFSRCEKEVQREKSDSPSTEKLIKTELQRDSHESEIARLYSPEDFAGSLNDILGLSTFSEDHNTQDQTVARPMLENGAFDFISDPKAESGRLVLIGSTHTSRAGGLLDRLERNGGWTITKWNGHGFDPFFIPHWHAKPEGEEDLADCKDNS